MSRRFRRGLVVGKLCPLHRGHQLVLDAAAASCDELVILSYSNPEFARCEPARRARWLASLYPAATRIVLDSAIDSVPPNDAAADDHRAFVAHVLQSRLGQTVDAVFSSEGYGDGFAASLGRLQRMWQVGAPDVAHVCVDRGRAQVPVSGSILRTRAPGLHGFLAPVVRADWIYRVCLLGGESTGKSTLARALANELGEPFVAEYGRELWEAQGGQLAYEDLARIAREQVRREEQAASTARAFLVCDTSPLTTLFYSREMFGRVDPDVQALADRTYDLLVLCGEEAPFHQDGTRREEQFRARGQAWYRDELARRGWNWLEARGSVAERVEAVMANLRFASAASGS
jgi:HTH-type transcriptional regulator, transcriptional repressor of NAD biosynthesis genes